MGVLNSDLRSSPFRSPPPPLTLSCIASSTPTTKTHDGLFNARKLRRGPKILSGELLDKGKKTVVLCHHGGRSMQVASFLASQAGFSVRASHQSDDMNGLSYTLTHHIAIFEKHTQDVLNASGGIHMYAEICDNSIPRY